MSSRPSASASASTSSLSLDDWDALAPLDEKCRASILRVTEASKERNIPARLARNPGATPLATRPATPNNGPVNLLRRATSRADTASALSLSLSASSSSTPQLGASSSSSNGRRGSSGLGGQRLIKNHSRTISSTSYLARSQNLHDTIDNEEGSEGTEYGGGGNYGNDYDDPLQLETPIETTQQFLDWFSKIEASMESEQERVYDTFRLELQTYTDNCQRATEMLQDSRGLIKEMEANYRFVEENSKALQVACEAMLEEQKHLVNVTEAIDARLEYFKELETATRALSQPGDMVVLQDDFLNMLERLDVCLEFLKNNRNYRDAEVYLIRFQQCQTRAMTLIKMHFLSILSSLGSEIASRLSSTASASSSSSSGKASSSSSTSSSVAVSNLSEAALQALLYSKFDTSITKQTRSLLYELEKRALKNPEEYNSLLQECLASWFALRNTLLAPVLAEEVRRMDPANTDLVKLARAGCAYLRTACAKEWTLFRDFFSLSGQTEVYQYLENLCDHLYDSLRPRILHEPKLEVLCELCNILQALISLDGDPDDDDDDDDAQTISRGPQTPGVEDSLYGEGDSSFDISINQHQRKDESGSTGSKDKLRFSLLLSTVLQDTQTRLVFRAQYVMEAEVLNYQPKPEDLEYPEKLQLSRLGGGSSSSSKGKTKEKLSYGGENGGNTSSNEYPFKMGVMEEDGVVVFKLPPEEITQSWYPTLQKTLWVLSRLHSYVNTAIFEDFAGEAVHLCRQSLTTAAEKISLRPTASKLDGQLFVIRHLLILKEMVRSIDLVQVERAVDFSSVTDALSSLLRNRSALLNPNALYQLASRGLPSFAETMRDAKRDLDGTLKVICEDFMTQSSLLVCSSIRAFLTRCQAFLSSAPAGSGPDLTTQPWATPEEVMKLHDEFVAEGQGMELGMQQVLEKMSLFLDQEQTVAVLIPPTQAEVLEHYTTFYNLVRSEYDFTTANALTPPARIRERLKAIAGQGDAGFIKSRDA